MAAQPNQWWDRLRRFLAPRWFFSKPPALGCHSPARCSRRRVVFWVCAFLTATSFGVYLRAEIHRRIGRIEFPTYAPVTQRGGTLLIVGGGSLPTIVRQQFIELAGQHDARIVVIPAMQVEPREYPDYCEDWQSYGVKSVNVLQADSRTEADDPAFSKILETATAVWLGGGQQTWLSALYRGTLVETRLKELLARNGVIGGTSAGAAVMSGIMIAGGREKPVIGRGFDLIPGVIIDQHFVRRNRIRRMQTALEQHPDRVGFGIDESTALQYGVDSGRFRVIGQSCVVVCVPDVSPGQRPQFRIEFLNPGTEFDIERLRHGDAVPPSSVDLDFLLLGE